jgi:hypothetical protein
MSDTKIKTSNIGNLAVTHALLHTDMDLTSKTVQVATPTSNTHPATKAYVDTEVANLIDSAPGTLDTLNELAAAINDDANFNATIASSIATKLPLAGGTLTGNLTLASTASGSSASPELELRRDITGADANYIGQIKFTADNDADQNIVFAKITGKILDASDGTEDGILEITHKKAGSNNISARFRSDSLQLINGTNLTVAGTTELTGNLTVDTNTLYVDTSNNKVGIGTANPDHLLHIGGSSNSLGTTAGDSLSNFRIQSDTSNNDSLLFTAQRLADGTTWTTAAQRIQRRVDSTLMGYMEFGHNGLDLITFGENSTEYVRIDGSGHVGIGTTVPGDANEGAGLRVHKYVDRAQYYSPAGSYAGSFGYTNNTNTKTWLSVDSGYNQTSSVSAGLFLSPFHSDANGSFAGHTIKSIRDGGALLFSRVNTATSTGTAATESEFMRISGSGNVGIGTADPNSNLHIKSTADVKLTLETDEDSDCWINLSGATSEASIGYEPATNSLRFANAADGLTSNVRMTIDASGNVGIGTTSPTAKLNVVGTSAEPGISIKSGGNGGVDPFKVTWSGGTEGSMFIVDDNGNVGIGTTGPNESLHIYRASGDASFRLQSSSQQLRIDQNSIRTTTDSSIGIFTNGNTNQMYLNQSTGNVGIGTSSPNQKLDVSGVTRSHKMEIQSSSSDATFLNIVQQAGGVDSRIDLKTSANNGGDPFIFFDAGGSNMVVGNHWSGTTNNQLRMGTGASVSSSSFKGISIDGLGKIISGPAIHINEGRGGSDTYNVTNSSEAYNLMMPSFYGSGSINQTYRHAYTINTPFHTTLWQGGGGNTVFTTWSKIGAEHYKDIFIETYTLYYSDIKIKVVTDGNANVSVWYAGSTYQNNVYSARWRVYPLQAATITMNPSSSQSAVYMVHQASGGHQMSATDTAASGSGPSTW